MSRPLLLQARKVVRLRDIRFYAAVEAFEAALAELRLAEEQLDLSEAAVGKAEAALLAAKRALPADPGQAPARLALIDAAAAYLVESEDAREAARRRLAEAEHQLDQARAAMLAARARRDAMTARAGSIASGIARMDEEAAAIESEERVALRIGDDG